MLYHCAPGRLPALNERFTTITLGFFKRHRDRADRLLDDLGRARQQTLTYLLKWDSLAEREQKWNAFQADRSGSGNAMRPKPRRSSWKGRRTSSWRQRPIRPCASGGIRPRRGRHGACEAVGFTPGDAIWTQVAMRRMVTHGGSFYHFRTVEQAARFFRGLQEGKRRRIMQTALASQPGPRCRRQCVLRERPARLERDATHR